MATVFKTFLNNDVATTRTLLNEAIPIDGKIMFGAYAEPPSIESNVKSFPHEMFQSVYDYTFLKSSSNHIFDLTLGYSSQTTLDTNDTLYPDAAQAKKQAIYNQFAQILVGYDKEGNIRRFDKDGNLVDTTTDTWDELYFASVARLLNKDEMKKGSFYLQLDLAAVEPAARRYTDPGTPPAWPVTADPTLTFKQFSDATGCPAGFFEYNAGSNPQLTFDISTDPASTNFATNGDDFFVIDATAAPISSLEWIYRFNTSLAPSPSNTGIDVNPGSDAITALQNLTHAINGTGTPGVDYEYGTDRGPNTDVKAVFNGTDAVTISSLTSDGDVITVHVICGSNTHTIDGQLFNNSGPVGNVITANFATDTTPITLDPDFDSLINSDDYRRISMIITDEGAQNDYRVNSPAGDYGILKIKEYKIEKWDAETNTISDVCVIDAEALQAGAEGESTSVDPSDVRKYNSVQIGNGNDWQPYNRVVGLVYYQAGVVAVTPYAFAIFGNNASGFPQTWSTPNTESEKGKVLASLLWDNSTVSNGGVTSNTWSDCAGGTIAAELVTAGFYPDTTTPVAMIEDSPSDLNILEGWEQIPIDSSSGSSSNATGFRRRMVRMAFNNTTELNSTIYFCRLNNNEFNYSANPTYLSESKILVKETTLDAPVSYITTVGLYSADNELLAQAKLSEPVRKDPTNEFVLRVRLDY